MLKVDQKKYIQNLLEFEGMSLCHLTVFPMKASSSLILYQVGDHVLTDIVAYQRLIGKLMYLACGTRPDITFVVEKLSCHNSDPRAGHIRNAKQILHYFKRTSTLDIV